MLTDEQYQKICAEFDQKAGCPVTVADRLSAFTTGAASMLSMIRGSVTVDEEKTNANDQ